VKELLSNSALKECFTVHSAGGIELNCGQIGICLERNESVGGRDLDALVHSLSTIGEDNAMIKSAAEGDILMSAEDTRAEEFFRSEIKGSTFNGRDLTRGDESGIGGDIAVGVNGDSVGIYGSRAHQIEVNVIGEVNGSCFIGYRIIIKAERIIGKCVLYRVIKLPGVAFFTIG
jgi:hypothetical protein